MKEDKTSSRGRTQLLRRSGCVGDAWLRRCFHTCANVPTHAHLKNMKEDKSSSRGRTHLLRRGGCKDVEWLGKFVNKGANDFSK